jgi:integrase
MAAENKLTDKHLRAVKSKEREQLLGDGGGLWVRVLPVDKGGAVNFYYRFQIAGKERRFNCGTYPETSLAAARERRNAARKLVQQGIDPTLKESSDRKAAAAAQVLESMDKSVDDLFDDWKRVYLSAHRSDKGAYVEAIYEYDIKALLGDMKARAVRLPHIVKVIDKILARGARRKANVVLSTLRQMFRHGLGRGIVETDPTLGLSKKQAGGKETPVERNLSFDEIKKLSDVMPAADLPPRIATAVWLILATGMRVGELTKARWSDIDLDKGQWVIPGEHSKNGKPHLVHVSQFARRHLDMLLSIRSGDYLLAGAKEKTHMSEKGITKAIRDRIRSEPLKRRTPRTKALMLPGGEWTPHDLRRTMASRMGDLGVAPHVIERCLNHVQQGIVGVYQRQEYLEERKAAYELWGKKLSRLSEDAA